MNKGASVTAKKLGLFAVAMFGFGYALVPLYDVLCEVTGLNGKTGEISQQEASSGKIDEQRLITVEFDTNVNASLPWKFEAKDYKMTVHPGEVAEAIFYAENQSDVAVIGQAVPSVAPTTASLYFNKTECFCFTKQVLEPGERKEMVVRFVVGSDLPSKYSVMTLSYTFFEAPEKNDEAVSKAKATNEAVTKS